MKNTLLLLTLLTSLNAYSQDWNLFPLNQESFYIDNSNLNYKLVDSYVMDSIRVSGIDSILYFRKNLDLQGAGSCYSDTLQYLPWGQSNLYSIDSLVQRNDTVFYFSNLSTTPFYFLPKAIVGQSWTVNSTYSSNDYNQITITCASLQQETYFGITDSVKTFTFTADGTSINQTPVDSFVMRLSQSHGLIEYVPFILFLYHPNNVNFSSIEIIGINKAGVLHGYKQPKFSDYFHLSVGDILLWEHHYDPANTMYPDWTEYLRDSITQVLITPDSVIYTYDRAKQDTGNIVTYQYGLIDKFLFTEFRNIVETTPNWVGIGNNRFKGWYPLLPNNVLYWFSSLLSLTIDSVSNDTTTAFSFFDDAHSMDTTTCQPLGAYDVFFNFTVDTKAGVTQHCFYNFDEDCYTLIGSLISGQQNGNIALSTNELISPTYFSINIFPNPANENIFIRNIPQSLNITYELFNSTGQKVKEGKLQDYSISTHELPSGLYFIKIETDRGTTTGKFIKN